MKLDPEIATEIVTSLKDIINHEINLFDTSGTIIASTDAQRIGMSHDGARIAAKKKTTLTIDYDDQFSGAKKGINVPVLFNNAVVAIIGITGKRSEVEPFGNIIKKMTEILIRENWSQMTAFNRRINYNNLVNMLIQETHDVSLTGYLSSLVDLDLVRTRCVIVGKIMPNDNEIFFDYEDLLPLIHAQFQIYPQSFFSLINQEICLFVDKEDYKELLPSLYSLQKTIQARYNFYISFGIGEEAAYTDYWRSYDEAKKTVTWLQFTRKNTIEKYSDMDYGLLLSSVPISEAKRISKRIFQNLTSEEIEEFKILFATYTKHNGSIIKCAEELFIHKNTFQYKLNRLAEKTGYNPRLLRDYAVLSSVFQLQDLIKFAKNANASGS